MEYKPHDYQQFAINYILEHPIAAVILGMGLGKTSITLTDIEQLIYDSFEVSKVLVVAPLRVARNTWSDEIHKWNHLKHLRYSIVLGSVAERKKALEADADIYIINRENLQWLIEQSGVNFFWDMVVLDELSSFKNWNSTLIWFGLTWSLELYQQTVARLWRQGQTAETVVVQHIITAGTIDEDVMKALANKDMTQNRLIAAVKARVTHGR